MFVYGCVYEKELNDIMQNKKSIRNLGKGSNTFDYEKGIQYFHFFLFSESAAFYSKSRKGIVAILQCDISFDILIQFKGCGFYEGVIPDYYIPIPEFAIPSEMYNLEFIHDITNEVKPEWARKNEYEEYLKSIPECYFAGIFTGFGNGYDKKSAKDLNWQKYMKNPSVNEICEVNDARRLTKPT